MIFNCVLSWCICGFNPRSHEKQLLKLCFSIFCSWIPVKCISCRASSWSLRLSWKKLCCSILCMKFCTDTSRVWSRVCMTFYEFKSSNSCVQFVHDYQWLRWFRRWWGWQGTIADMYMCDSMMVLANGSPGLVDSSIGDPDFEYIGWCRPLLASFQHCYGFNWLQDNDLSTVSYHDVILLKLMHCSFITLLKCRFHPSTEPNLQLHLWKWQLGTGITFPRFQIGVSLWDAVLFSNLRDQQTSGAMWVCIFYLYHAEGLPESMLGTCSVWKETPGLWWW